ncbi:MAG: ABC-F family ATP-binding cassette domain-containing protein [Ignavibacteria bacterium]|nr:ABC-F family ATP-binding cassette domain-containing protein [Ignavibacteria bacterium]
MIDLQKISLQFSGEYLFRDLSLKIFSGDRVALVGANGTGKSSLLKIIFGLLEPESGIVNKQKRLRLGYLPQEYVASEADPLLLAVEHSVTDIQELRQEEEDITSALAESGLDDETRDDYIRRLGNVHARLEDLDSFTLRSRCERILIGLGFNESDFDRPLTEFSGGWQMRVALAKILVADPDLILLDEPTNHLDIDSLSWLIGYLKGFRGALLLISHDRHFVNQVTTRTWEIFLRKVNVFKGNYDAYLVYKEQRDQLLEEQAAQQQKEIENTRKFIERFRYKATKAKQVQSRIKQLEKVELIELPEKQGEIHFRFLEAPPSGQTVMDVHNVAHSYGSKEVFSRISFAIQRGEKIAFVGPNGAGKTTMARILAGVLEASSGTCIPGHNVSIAFYSQEVTENLNPEEDIFEAIESVAEDRSIGQIRGLAGSFLFSGDDVFKKIKVLSGGEKSRVALLKLMLSRANFLLLDEPTNHLDIASKKILQQALINFTGSVVIVSHDVDFLEPIAQKVLEFRDGSVKEYPGNIVYYLEKKEAESVSVENGSNSGKKNPATKVEDNLSRKDIKRYEAERRQQKHALTKDLKTQIQKLESLIENFELKIKNIETELADPTIYSDAEKIKQLNADYKQLKMDLGNRYSEWEVKSEELFEIEKQFD